MSSKTIIPEVEIKIGNNLYIQIKDVSFIPADKGVYSIRLEDCYPPEPAECDWKNENAKLVIKKFEYVETDEFAKQILGINKAKKLVSEKEFPVDDGFVYEYYDQIITAVEEMKNNE